MQWRCDGVPALTASTTAGLGADNTTLVHAGLGTSQVRSGRVGSGWVG